MDNSQLLNKNDILKNYQFSIEFNKIINFLDDLSSLYPRIILYGAGTFARVIASYIPSNIVLIVDGNEELQNKKISNITISTPKKILEINYDIILVTVLGREDLIFDFLVKDLNIHQDKLYFFNINKNFEYDKYINNLKLKLHYKYMGLKYKSFPYDINNLTTINLIFFIGIGDYLYVTPVIEEIKKQNPNLIINAFVSKNFDKFNSPLVFELIESNPNVNKVKYFNGISKKNDWFHYDFSDVKNYIDDENSIFPIFYEDFDKKMKHRVLEMFRVFSFENCKKIIPLPKLYIQDKDCSKSKEITEYIDKLNKKVVILHLEARSSGYSFTDNEIFLLAKSLIEKGFFVINIGKIDFKEFKKEDFFSLDIKQFTLNESIAFIDSLKSEKRFIAINSVMFPISSALSIPMLALYIFNDSLQTRQTFYKNMHVLTVDKECYEFLPEGYCTLIDKNEVNIKNGQLVYYGIELVIKNFSMFMKNKS